jgi:tRNA uridine 5-carboxymethylaminomethyl modification enzyme
VEIKVKYKGYIDREEDQIRRVDNIKSMLIPSWVDYDRIKTLRFESRQKLNKIKPSNLAQASRIPGVNPADIAIIAMLIKRGYIS